MNDIALITPPDFLYNDSYNILLVCPSKDIKQKLNDILLNTSIPLNLMVYETPEDDLHMMDWLLNAIKISDTVIVDLDNCDIMVKKFASHIIAQSKTFYLTNDGETPYSLISKGRIYDFTWLEQILNRGKNE